MLWKFIEPNAHIVYTVQMFIRLLEVKVSDSALRKELEEHPDYPSLLSIRDILSKYGIESIAAEFVCSELRNIPPPYIIPLRADESGMTYFTVVREITDSKASVLDAKSGKWTTIPADDLAHISTGVALLAEPMPDAGEAGYKKSRKQEQIERIGRIAMVVLTTMILGSSIFRAFLQDGTSAVLPMFYLIFTIIGLGLSFILVWYDVDQSNPVVQQLCKMSNTVNCSAILQTSAAKVGGIGWSQIGCSFFAGMLLLLLTMGITTPHILSVAGSTSLVAVGFVFYSVYFQWKVAKQWCRLCLYVQGVLLAQAVIGLSLGWPWTAFFSISHIAAFASLIVFIALSLALFTLVIPIAKTVKNIRHTNRVLNRLKYNPLVFDALLRGQNNLSESTEGLGITLGKRGAANKIIKVCNPYCGPCSKAHQVIEGLLRNNPDIELRIIFTATTDDADKKREPVRHLLAIAEKEEQFIEQALNDWYVDDEKDYEAFASKYPLNEDLSLQDGKIAAMRKWCDVQGISATPTIYVNDHPLPEIYSIQDLKSLYNT